MRTLASRRGHDCRMDALPSAADGTLSFDCPRCGTAVEERFYGPCDACRAQLRATMRLDSRDIEIENYAPKVNVVPNQVALKAD